MKTVFCIKCTVEDNLTPHAFNSSEEAQAVIDTNSADVRKEMSVEEVPRYEYAAMVSISFLFDLEDAIAIKNAIGNLDDDDREHAYKQIGFAEMNWCGQMYAKHFKVALLNGEHDGFESIEPVYFSVFLDQLRTQLEEAQSKVDCELKEINRAAISEKAFYDAVSLAFENSEVNNDTFEELSSLANKSELTIEHLSLMYQQRMEALNYKKVRLEINTFLEVNNFPTDEPLLSLINIYITEETRKEYLSLIDKLEIISLELNETQRRLDFDF